MLKKFVQGALFFLIALNAISQKSTDRNAALAQYGQYIQPFIENIHQIQYQQQLKSYSTDFILRVSFNIDTLGNVINYHTKENQTPTEVQDYIRYLVNQTNGFWLPQIRNCKPVISDSIVCFVYLNSKKISLSERLKTIDKKNEEQWNNSQAEVSKPDRSQPIEPNTCYIILTY